MHARYYSPGIGRFLSVDPSGESADQRKPQTWNRYAYAFNNPLIFVDPDGEVGVKCDACGFGTADQALAALPELLTAETPEQQSLRQKLVGPAIGLGLLATPGPDELGVALAIGTRVGQASKALQLVSRIKESPALVRAARSLSGNQQKAIDRLTSRLEAGVFQQGIGTRAIKGLKGVFELRAASGARVLFRVTNGKIEILAKFNKSTQKQVFNAVEELLKK